jgi:hypothetical protein
MEGGAIILNFERGPSKPKKIGSVISGEKI